MFSACFNAKQVKTATVEKIDFQNHSQVRMYLSKFKNSAELTKYKEEMKREAIKAIKANCKGSIDITKLSFQEIASDKDTATRIKIDCEAICTTLVQK